MLRRHTHTAGTSGLTAGYRHRPRATRRWLLLPAALFFAVLAGSALGAKSLTAQNVGPPVVDFTVDTSTGPLSLASESGNVLVYFFSFPG